MNNREWLSGLDVADLAAWFDAEHVEPDDGLAPVSSSSLNRTGNQDSREKLEAEMAEYLERDWYMLAPGLLEKMRGWLERQDAITRRECEDAAWKANYRHMKARADKLQDQVDELTAERDRESEANRSHARVIAKLESERDALRIYRDSWVSKATVLEGDVDRLTAERDELREKLSQAIGHASDIIALQDLTAVDVDK